MIMGGREHPAPTSTLTDDMDPECPYGDRECPKMLRLRTDLESLKDDNKALTAEVVKSGRQLSAIRESISSLKWLVFILVCGATGVGVMI